MKKRLRKMIVSIEIMKEMFTQGHRSNYVVLEGWPPLARIHDIRLDAAHNTICIFLEDESFHECESEDHIPEIIVVCETRQ